MKVQRIFLILSLLGIGLPADAAEYIFGTPSLVPGINTSGFDRPGSISADGLEWYVPQANDDIFVATRETVDAPFGPLENLGEPINSVAFEDGPNLSMDGLSLYFISNRQGGTGHLDATACP